MLPPAVLHSKYGIHGHTDHRTTSCPRPRDPTKYNHGHCCGYGRD